MGQVVYSSHEITSNVVDQPRFMNLDNRLSSLEDAMSEIRASICASDCGYNDRIVPEQVFTKTVSGRIDPGHIKTGRVAYTGSTKTQRIKAMPEIEKVIFNDPATVVIWNDGTKTIVKTRQKGKKKDKFSPEFGLAMAIAKKYYGNRSKFVKAVENAKHCG